MAKLSVIIPIYNTDEVYLENCLNSIFNSSLKDIEVIMVDDGSTKNYDEFVKRFSDKLIYYKISKQGTLKARLFGVEKATSPYIGFVDSDDTISFNYLEAMYKKAVAENADICLNDWAFQTEKTNYYCSNDTTIKNDICYTGDMPIKKFFNQAGKEHSFYVLWNKIFKKEILHYSSEEISKLDFQELVFAEDVLICYFAFKKATKIVNCHIGYYFYRIHRSQQITTDTMEKLENHIVSNAKVFDAIENDIKNIESFQKFLPLLDDWRNLLCSSNYQVAKRAKYNELFDVIKKSYRKNIIKKLPKDHAKSYYIPKLLPRNITEIDEKLKEIFYAEEHINVYAKKGSYAFNSLVKMKAVWGLKFDFVTNKKQATIIIPKSDITLKQKIFYNSTIYRIGMMLFPKGSKMRRFLKSKF